VISPYTVIPGNQRSDRPLHIWYSPETHLSTGQQHDVVTIAVRVMTPYVFRLPDWPPNDVKVCTVGERVSAVRLHTTDLAVEQAASGKALAVLLKKPSVSATLRSCHSSKYRIHIDSYNDVLSVTSRVILRKKLTLPRFGYLIAYRSRVMTNRGTHSSGKRHSVTYSRTTSNSACEKPLSDLHSE
jgi:hypothetical protein